LITAVLVAMLRRRAWLHPTPVAMSGGLAVGGVAATAMALLHDLDAAVMVLVGTLGATALIVAPSGFSAAASSAGPRHGGSMCDYEAAGERAREPERLADPASPTSITHCAAPAARVLAKDARAFEETRSPVRPTLVVPRPATLRAG